MRRVNRSPSDARVCSLHTYHGVFLKRHTPILRLYLRPLESRQSRQHRGPSSNMWVVRIIIAITPTPREDTMERGRYVFACLHISALSEELSSTQQQAENSANLDRHRTESILGIARLHQEPTSLVTVLENLDPAVDVHVRMRITPYLSRPLLLSVLRIGLCSCCAFFVLSYSLGLRAPWLEIDVDPLGGAYRLFCLRSTQNLCPSYEKLGEAEAPSVARVRYFVCTKAGVFSLVNSAVKNENRQTRRLDNAPSIS